MCGNMISSCCTETETVQKREDFKSMTKKVHRLGILLVLLLVLAVVIYSTCTARVPTGYTGILTTFGKVENYTMEAGFHFKSPFQNVILMDNREQKTSFTTQSFSSDIQQVDIVGSVNYSVNKSTAMTLYREVGTEYFTILVMPRLLENTKAVFSQYTAENLVAARADLSQTIRERLSREMEHYGITVVSVSLENIDFTDSFTDAVESKQVAGITLFPYARPDGLGKAFAQYAGRSALAFAAVSTLVLVAWAFT